MRTSFSAVNLQSDMAVVSLTTARSIAQRDSVKLSSTPTEYTEVNAAGYYIAINTWLLSAAELSGQRTSWALLECIKSMGLIDTINTCANTAQQVIDGFGGIVAFDPTASAILATMADVDDDVVLQVLRFLKRFSPLRADKVLSETLSRFYDVNKRCRSIGQRNPIAWLERAVSEKLSGFLRGIQTFYDPAHDIGFSNGVCQDGKRLQQKLAAYASEVHYWCDPRYPIGNPARIRECVKYGKDGRRYYRVTPKSVPKSYKSGRIIAPEDSYCLAEMRAVLAAVRKVCAANRVDQWFDPEDQEKNRMAAEEASRDGSMATIDLSSASDSISRSLAYRLLPREYIDLFDPYIPTHFNMNGQTVKCNMLFPSGNPLCFDTEALIFLAIYQVATEYCELFLGETLTPPLIFGDDGLCDVKAYATVTEFLEMLGFVVNTDKSYAQGTLFRESCGIDACNGFRLTTVYWPRTELDITHSESVVSLVALQRNLYNVSYSAQAFLADTVRQLEPRMTSSLPGTECSDMWSVSPQFGKRSAPVHTVTDEQREAVKQFREKYPTLMLREAHLAPVAVYDTDYPLCLDLEMYYYVHFLRFGPRYDDELSRLLRVSSSVRVDGDGQKPRLEFRKVTR